MMRPAVWATVLLAPVLLQTSGSVLSASFVVSSGDFSACSGARTLAFLLRPMAGDPAAHVTMGYIECRDADDGSLEGCYLRRWHVVVNEAVQIAQSQASASEADDLSSPWQCGYHHSSATGDVASPRSTDLFTCCLHVPSTSSMVPGSPVHTATSWLLSAPAGLNLSSYCSVVQPVVLSPARGITDAPSPCSSYDSPLSDRVQVPNRSCWLRLPRSVAASEGASKTPLMCAHRPQSSGTDLSALPAVWHQLYSSAMREPPTVAAISDALRASLSEQVFALSQQVSCRSAHSGSRQASPAGSPQQLLETRIGSGAAAIRPPLGHRTRLLSAQIGRRLAGRMQTAANFEETPPLALLELQAEKAGRNPHSRAVGPREPTAQERVGSRGRGSWERQASLLSPFLRSNSRARPVHALSRLWPALALTPDQLAATALLDTHDALLSMAQDAPQQSRWLRHGDVPPEHQTLLLPHAQYGAEQRRSRSRPAHRIRASERQQAVLAPPAAASGAAGTQLAGEAGTALLELSAATGTTAGTGTIYEVIIHPAINAIGYILPRITYRLIREFATDQTQDMMQELLPDLTSSPAAAALSPEGAPEGGSGGGPGAALGKELLGAIGELSLDLPGAPSAKAVGDAQAAGDETAFLEEATAAVAWLQSGKGAKEPKPEAPKAPAAQLIVALADAIRDPLEARAVTAIPRQAFPAAKRAGVRKLAQRVLPVLVAQVSSHVHTAVLRRTALSIAHAVHDRMLQLLLPALTRSLALSVLASISRSPSEDLFCAYCDATGGPVAVPPLAPAAASSQGGKSGKAAPSATPGATHAYCGLCAASRHRALYQSRIVTHYAEQYAASYGRWYRQHGDTDAVAAASIALGLAGIDAAEVMASADTAPQPVDKAARQPRGVESPYASDADWTPDEEAAALTGRLAQQLAAPTPPPGIP